MQKIEQTDYGFRITNTGYFSYSEAEDYKMKILEKLSEHKSSFSVLVDIRGLIPLEPEVGEIIKEIMRTCAQMSIERVAIVVSSPVVKAQQQQFSFDSLTVAYDRTIDANKYPDWEERALRWVRDGIEPFPVEV